MNHTKLINTFLAKNAPPLPWRFKGFNFRISIFVALTTLAKKKTKRVVSVPKINKIHLSIWKILAKNTQK